MVKRQVIDYVVDVEICRNFFAENFVIFLDKIKLSFTLLTYIGGHTDDPQTFVKITVKPAVAYNCN